MESKQINGVLGSDSSKVVSKFKIHDSPYSGPSDSKKKKSNVNNFQNVLLHFSYAMFGNIHITYDVFLRLRQCPIGTPRSNQQ